MNTPYNQIDHYHCWQYPDEDGEYKLPPCGQKIEHLKCCLCGLQNPIISTLLSQHDAELVERGEKLKKPENCIEKELGYHDKNCENCEYNQAIDEFIKIIKGENLTQQ